MYHNFCYYFWVVEDGAEPLCLCGCMLIFCPTLQGRSALNIIMASDSLRGSGIEM